MNPAAPPPGTMKEGVRSDRPGPVKFLAGPGRKLCNVTRAKGKGGMQAPPPKAAQNTKGGREVSG